MYLGLVELYATPQKVDQAMLTEGQYNVPKPISPRDWDDVRVSFYVNVTHPYRI